MKTKKLFLSAILLLSFGCANSDDLLKDNNTASLTDLPWLKKIVDELEADSAAGYPQHARIYQCTYRDGIGFLLEMCVGCPDFGYELRNREGESLCIMWGLAGDPCPEFNVEFENKTLIHEINRPALEDPVDLAGIRIKERPCEALEYVGKIGNDFDAALDSLRRLKNIPLEIDKALLEVLFDYDSRDFYGIAYGDCAMYADVLDAKGNYYLRTWYCPHENGIQEESIFDDNKRFTVNNGCAKIVYQSRIGNDFDSALDSLIKTYEPLLNELATNGYNIEKFKINNVGFSYDDREFFRLTFMDKVITYRPLITDVVVDEKGNYFYEDLSMCED